MDNLNKQLNDLIEKDINEALNNVIKDTDDAIKIDDTTDINNSIQQLKISVNKKIASQVFERAKYYCPVDTGKLRDSGHIVNNVDGSCDIIFDAPYAFEVHEKTWVFHKYPTCAKFLDRAVQEISAFYGL